MVVHTPTKYEDFRGISLCAGVAGLDLGLHLTEPGYRTVCHVERNSYAAATLVARMADTSLAPAPVWDDLKSFDGKPWRGKVHIVTAGYPCQPFTFSGLRQGEDDPRHLWPDVARVVSEIQPEWCFFENVQGHLTLGLRDVIADLQRMGYRVAVRVQSAAEVGASHQRNRLFIVAHADIQRQRQPGLHSRHPPRAEVQDRSKPSGQTSRDQERDNGLDTVLGHSDSERLDTRSIPFFAPGPSDFREWGEVLRSWPELKPCLYRPDDGLAHGVDRSAAAGNGVVSMAAAWAWHHLKSELLS